MTKFITLFRACIATTMVLIFLLSGTTVISQPYELIVNASVSSPVNPYLGQLVNPASQLMVTMQRTNTNATVPLKVKLWGKIERITPLPATLSLDPGFRTFQSISINPGVGTTTILNSNDITQAFGNFSKDNIVNTGVNVDDFKSGSNFKLGEGHYKFCIVAYDYNTPGYTKALSDPNNSCTFFDVCYAANPPELIMPINTIGSNYTKVSVTATSPLNFVWNVPTGSCGLNLNNITYDLTIVKMLAGQTETDAVQHNPVEFQRTDIMTTSFQFDTLQNPYILKQGETYAVRIKAKSSNLMNYVEFNNGGYSKVGSFVYEGAAVPVVANIQVLTNDDLNSVSCSCIKPLSNNMMADISTVSTGTIINANGFNITIISVTKNSNNGSFSGTGKVNLPLVNSKIIPIGVYFTDIQVNSNKDLINGTIYGKIKNGIGFLPTTSGPNPSLIPFNSQQTTDLKNYIDNNRAQVLSQVNTAVNNTVFELPFGIDKDVFGGPVTIEITALKINSTKAVIDAVTIINTPDGGSSISEIALGAKNICIDPTHFCGDAKLFLAADLTIPSLNLTLKSTNSPRGGTYVVIDNSGFKNLQIDAEIAIPTSLIVKKSNKTSQVIATVTATTDSGWTNWVGRVGIDPFVMAGNTDFGFTVTGNAFYDHSDIRNPLNLPSFSQKPELNNINWHGLFIPQLVIELPAVFKNDHSNTITANINNIIVDNHGITGNLNSGSSSQPILAIGNGNLGGWYYSIDNINLQIIDNGFTSGGMVGKVLLPISDKTKTNQELDYSCVISNNNGLKYDFTVNQKSDLDFPIWNGNAVLESTSNIHISGGAGVAFSANATLNGHLTIGGDLPEIGHVDFAHMKFENLVFSTSPNYVSVGSFVFSLGSPQHSIGGNIEDDLHNNNAPIGTGGGLIGFGVTINKVVPYFSSNKFGLKFDLDVKLSDKIELPNAKTTFDIYGYYNIDSSTLRPTVYFGGASLEKLSIHGSLPGLASIDGSITFTHNDSTWGDAFIGTASATFNVGGGIGVKANVAFGSKNAINFWYVDAMADFGLTGIPLGLSGLSVYGFGGGASYHMAYTPAPALTSISGKDTVNANSSGITYTPDASVGVGVQATLLFGLAARPTFNADVTLGMTFNESGGFRGFSLVGNARVMEISTDACVTGHIEVNYDVSTNTLQGDISANMAFPPNTGSASITGSGKLAFYFGSTGWYVKLGTPNDRISIKAPFNLADFNAYLEVGSLDIDPMPPLPSDVLRILRESGVSIEMFSENKVLSKGEGFILGGQFHFDYTGKFLIFKASVGMTAGFDLSLLKYDINNNSCGAIGAEGWYAQGQVYAGIWGSVDISTDWFGDINILDAGAAAVLQAGMPNPTWVKGAFGAYYSVLDGLISGHLHFEFSYGDKPCIPFEDALANFKLISEIKPTDASKDLKVTMNSSVAFNVKLFDNKQYTKFKIDQKDGYGNHHFRYFRFIKDDVKSTLRNITLNKSVAITPTFDSDGFSVVYVPDSLLNRLTAFVLNVTAKLEELDTTTNNWDTAKYKSGNNVGKALIEEYNISFNTDKGLDSIPENMVTYTYPFKMQRFFMQQEASVASFGSGNSILKIDQSFNLNESINMLGDKDGFNQSFYGKLIPLKPKGVERKLNLVNSDSVITLTLPTDLTPNTIYAIQFIGSWTPNNYQTASFAKVNTNLIYSKPKPDNLGLRNRLGGTDTISSRSVKLNDLIPLKANEKQLYVIYFKTSDYNRFTNKANNMPITHLSFALQGAPKDSCILSISDLNDMANKKKSLKDYIAQRLKMSPSNAINLIVRYTKAAYFGGTENFDDYDLIGNYKNGKQEALPLLDISNVINNNWINSFVNSLKKSSNIKDLKEEQNTHNANESNLYVLEHYEGKNVHNLSESEVTGKFNFLAGMNLSTPLHTVATEPTFTLKAPFSPHTIPGVGVVPAVNNVIAQFVEIHGGDPSNQGLAGMGQAYDLGISTSAQGASVSGGTVSVGYNLPGTIGHSGSSGPPPIHFGVGGSKAQ